MEEGKGFLGFLTNLEDGNLIPQLDEDVRTVVAALRQQGEHAKGAVKGALTVTVRLALEDGVVTAVAETKVVTPKPVRRRSVFFPTIDNRLSRTDPRQGQLFDGAAEPGRALRSV